MLGDVENNFRKWFLSASIGCWIRKRLQTLRFATINRGKVFRYLFIFEVVLLVVIYVAIVRKFLYLNILQPALFEVDRFCETARWERSLMVAVDCFGLLSSARSQSKPHQGFFLQARSTTSASCMRRSDPWRLAAANSPLREGPSSFCVETGFHNVC